MKNPALAEKLSMLDKDELVGILLRYAESDEEIKRDLMMRQAGQEDAAETARELIRASIEKYSERGYVKYTDVEDAVKGAAKVLDNVERGRYSLETMIQIHKTVAEELMGLMEDADDSSGHICGMMERNVELLTLLPEKDGFSEDGFNEVFGIAMSKILDGWSEWRFALLESLIPLCAQDRLRERFVGCLRQIMENRKSSKYDREKAEQAECAVILAFDGEREAERYMGAHLGNSEFRESAIETAVKRKDLDLALKLCLEGEEHDKELPGLVEKWRKSRYSVYELKGDLAKQKELAMEFIKDSDYAYFLKLKKLTPPEEWPQALERVLDECEGAMRQSMLERILVNEGLKLRLLRHCEENPAHITAYHSMLIPEHEDEASAIFADHVVSQARKASSKEQCAAVCKLLESFAQAFGPERGSSLRKLLMDASSNRPAFKEALGKAKI
jgi:hypothetical protein